MPPKGVNPRILIHTPLGDVKVEVYEAEAPITSRNFLRYVDAGLYEGMSFFRTVTMENQLDSEVKIEVVQGGTIPRDGAYPSTYRAIEHEPTEMTGLRHVDGVVSMARMEPGTATSSFFICVGNQPELDFGGRRNPDGQGFAVFGWVVEGMGVVRSIHIQPHEGQKLTPPVKITSISRVT